jgi:uncharacterized protein
MPVNGHPIPPPMLAMLRHGLADLEGVHWFDAHTHMGHNDPDGMTATAAEVLAALDEAGMERALIFAMHEPDGYGPANDAVLEACRASGGRLEALGRVDPNAGGAVEEARRCLDAGARGIKLHPRSDAFGLPHPVVDEVVALAAEQRAPVLFHAGRGIPNLGDAAVALCRRHPELTVILAHVGVSDLGLLGPAAAELPGLCFDTSWWQAGDVLQLYTTIPPGQIFYASDAPYGPPASAAFIFDRCSRAAGLATEARRSIAGEQLVRVLEGEAPLDLGPAPGMGVLGGRVLEAERANAYLTAAVQAIFRGGDPTEALALARSACQTRRPGAPHELLALCEALIGRAQALLLQVADPRAAVGPAMLAQVLAGTPSVPPPPAPAGL